MNQSTWGSYDSNASLENLDDVYFDAGEWYDVSMWGKSPQEKEAFYRGELQKLTTEQATVSQWVADGENKKARGMINDNSVRNLETNKSKLAVLNGKITELNGLAQTQLNQGQIANINATINELFTYKKLPFYILGGVGLLIYLIKK